MLKVYLAGEIHSNWRSIHSDEYKSKTEKKYEYY